MRNAFNEMKLNVSHRWAKSSMGWILNFGNGTWEAFCDLSSMASFQTYVAFK